jgi:hypothetical protein
MGTPEWIAIAVAAGAALVGTFTRRTIRLVSFAVMIVALIGLAFNLYRGAEAQKTATPGIGSNNTIVNVPTPPNMGSGNTIIGPTDNRGNTIINQGGTAIGSGSCADSTSIAIGAGARAGCPSQPQNK